MNDTSDSFSRVNDLWGFALRNNAYFKYNKFKRLLYEGKIKNDGNSDLLNLIDKYVFDDTTGRFRKELEPGTLFYRARPVDINILNKDNGFYVDKDRHLTCGFDEGNSREAPLGKGGTGRNNISGVSYLYLADSISTACTEVRPRLGQFVSVAGFRLKKSVNVVDFSEDVHFVRAESLTENAALGLLFTMIMREFFVPVSERSDDYLPTQVISDHIRKSGVDGIVYRSYFDRTGKNYTFFNSSRSTFEFINSSLFVHDCSRHMYYDFNNKRMVESVSFGDEQYNEKSADEILHDVSDYLIKEQIKKEASV